MAAKSPSEIYTFLGIQKGAHFFVHNVREPYDASISYQVYNVLISGRHITSSKDIVIIYEIRGDSCDVVIIGHHESRQIPKVNKENLGRFFVTLMKAERNDITVVKYCHIRKCYLLCHVKNNNFTNCLAEVTSEPISIVTVTTVMTSKPIPAGDPANQPLVASNQPVIK
jgi:hypothetical protein